MTRTGFEDAKIPVLSSKSEPDILTKKDFSTFIDIITGVGATGGGQSHSGRDVLHASGARRIWTDPQMWTHVFLAAGGKF